MHNIHPIWDILNCIEVRLEFVHPGIACADSGFIAVNVVFGVSIIDVVSGGLGG